MPADLALPGLTKADSLATTIKWMKLAVHQNTHSNLDYQYYNYRRSNGDPVLHLQLNLTCDCWPKQSFSLLLPPIDGTEVEPARFNFRRLDNLCGRDAWVVSEVS